MSSSTTTTTSTIHDKNSLHTNFRISFLQVVATMKALNKELNQCLLSLELDPEKQARNVLSISEALAQENDRVRLLLTSLRRHQSEQAKSFSQHQKREESLQSVRSTLATLHGARESLSHAIEESRPEVEAAASSTKRPLPLGSILQLSKRIRYTSAWPSFLDAPPPNDTKSLPAPYSKPAPQEDHMKQFSLLFGTKRYALKKKLADKKKMSEKK